MTLLALVLLGAVVGLDVVSFPQIMISRPIVGATIAGLLAGAVDRGLLAGAVLEIFALETLPVGASRYPEWGTAGVVTGSLFATAVHPTPGALVLAALGGMITAWAGGWSMYVVRRLNGAWATRAGPALAAGRPDVLVALHRRGLAADLVRSALVTAAGLLVLTPLARLAAARWAVGDVATLAILLALAVAVGVAGAWKLARGGARLVYFWASLVVGLALVVWA